LLQCLDDPFAISVPRFPHLVDKGERSRQMPPVYASGRSRESPVSPEKRTMLNRSLLRIPFRMRRIACCSFLWETRSLNRSCRDDDDLAGMILQSSCALRLYEQSEEPPDHELRYDGNLRGVAGHLVAEHKVLLGTVSAGDSSMRLCSALPPDA